jgi:ABC-type spermidine/putrescine transport system permease subunit II
VFLLYKPLASSGVVISVACLIFLLGLRMYNKGVLSFTVCFLVLQLPNFVSNIVLTAHEQLKV